LRIFLLGVSSADIANVAMVHPHKEMKVLRRARCCASPAATEPVLKLGQYIHRKSVPIIEKRSLL